MNMYIIEKLLRTPKRGMVVLLFFSIGAQLAFAQPGNGDVFGKKYIKKLIPKVVDWQLNNPRHDPKDWTNGAFYAGVFAAWETTKSKAIYQALLDTGNAQQWQPHKRWYHADDVAISQTYIDVYRKEKRLEMIQPTRDTLNLFVSRPYPDRSGVEVIKWWWCDALFMGPPALVKLGMATKDRQYLDASDTYFRETYDLLYNRDERLFARDLNFVIKADGSGRKEANGQRIFWSRGNGWVMGGLVRILQELPMDYPERPFYETLFKEMADRVARLQPQDGLWRASLLDPEAYPGGEVSGSGFFCYALAWGINNDLLDKQTYLPVVEKTWKALTACISEEGRVGWVQPIGGSPQKNFGPDSWEVYGTGAFLLAASEVIKLKR